MRKHEETTRETNSRTAWPAVLWRTFEGRLAYGYQEARENPWTVTREEIEADLAYGRE